MNIQFIGGPCDGENLTEDGYPIVYNHPIKCEEGYRIHRYRPTDEITAEGRVIYKHDGYFLVRLP